MQKAVFTAELTWGWIHCDPILLDIGISLLPCMLFRRWSLQRNPGIDSEGRDR